jgi:transcriptional regulator with XRE-family HTH domain/tetratricopeptide (TPR) repeat protein
MKIVPSSPQAELTKGETIRRARILKGLSQSELARRSGAHPSNIWKYEKGVRVPRPGTMERILAALDMPLARTGSLSALDHLVEVPEGKGARRNLPLAADPAALARLQGELARDLERTVDLALLEINLLRESGGDPQAPPPPEGEDVPAFWRKLIAFKPERRSWLVKDDPAHWNPGLCRWLCDQSEAMAASDAEEARKLAELAKTVAQKLRRCEPANGVFVRLQGQTEALVANALRVAGEHAQADAAFAQAWDLWSQGEDQAGLLSEARLRDCEASLRREQRRFAEAEKLHALALEAARPSEVGTILLNRSATLEEMGDYEGALAALAEAAPRIDDKSPPRHRLILRFNQAACLCRLERAREARPIVIEVRKLAEELGNDLDLVRTLALEALVDAGLGKIDAAIESLEEVCREFRRRGHAYDFALEALDLALLYRQKSRWPEIRELAEQMVAIFQERNIHRETIAAVILFQEAAEKEAVTVDLVRRLRDYLKEAQAQPGLPFEARR